MENRLIVLSALFLAIIVSILWLFILTNSKEEESALLAQPAAEELAVSPLIEESSPLAVSDQAQAEAKQELNSASILSPSSTALGANNSEAAKKAANQAGEADRVDNKAGNEDNKATAVALTATTGASVFLLIYVLLIAVLGALGLTALSF